jgi:rSAM/selenodomain-associated transferase 1
LNRRLIVYAKRPFAGYAKTRLGATIGLEEAAGVYARLIYSYLLDLVRAGLGAVVELSVAAPADVPFFAEAFPEFIVRAQVEGDLGQRMSASFEQAFSAGADQVVLTGSDIPGLDGTLVRSAFQALETAPVTIGPAADGGYYLIGMCAPGADLFADIAWSTADVLVQTEALARSHGLAISRLQEQCDIDVYCEYVQWRESLVNIREHAIGE